MKKNLQLQLLLVSGVLLTIIGLRIQESWVVPSPPPKPLQPDWSSTNQTYCMMWCPGAQATPHYNYPAQLSSQQDLGVFCCKVCTLQSCFQVLKDDMTAEEQDVTLVTFMTPDRLDNFDRINAQWKGPKVLTLFVHDYLDESPQVLETKLARVDEKMQSWSNLLVVIHVARKEQDSKLFDPVTNAPVIKNKLIPWLPINSLRNVAMDLTRSKFFFAIDGDFYTSTNAYPTLKAIVSDREKFRLNYKFAIILPSFEFRPCLTSRADLDWDSMYPVDTTSFFEHYHKLRVRPFESGLETPLLGLNPSLADPVECSNLVDSTYAKYTGVEYTKCREWAELSQQALDQGNAETLITSLPEIPNSFTYEPYFVVSKENLARYCEVFVGRFYDKISFVSATRASGFRFYRLEKEFLFHQEHDISAEADKALYFHMHRMRVVFRNFIRFITNKHKMEEKLRNKLDHKN